MISAFCRDDRRQDGAPAGIARKCMNVEATASLRIEPPQEHRAGMMAKYFRPRSFGLAIETTVRQSAPRVIRKPVWPISTPPPSISFFGDWKNQDSTICPAFRRAPAPGCRCFMATARLSRPCPRQRPARPSLAVAARSADQFGPCVPARPANKSLVCPLAWPPGQEVSPPAFHSAPKSNRPPPTLAVFLTPSSSGSSNCRP